LKLIGDLLNVMKIHICRYGVVDRIFGAVIVAVSAKPRYQTTKAIAAE
jgi:hypothetical protein